MRWLEEFATVETDLLVQSSDGPCVIRLGASVQNKVAALVVRTLKSEVRLHWYYGLELFTIWPIKILEI